MTVYTVTYFGKYMYKFGHDLEETKLYKIRQRNVNTTFSSKNEEVTQELVADAIFIPVMEDLPNKVAISYFPRGISREFEGRKAYQLVLRK